MDSSLASQVVDAFRRRPSITAVAHRFSLERQKVREVVEKAGLAVRGHAPGADRSTLTAAQRRVFDAVVRSIRERGYAPSLRELADELDIASTNGVRDHLRSIARKGYIRLDGATARGLVLVEGAASRTTEGITVSCPNDDASGAHVRATIHFPELPPAECAARWAGIDAALGRCACGATTTMSGRVRS